VFLLMTKQEKLQQDKFIDYFLYSAYANMEMENEVHEKYDKHKLYQRYKVIIDNLIKE